MNSKIIPMKKFYFIILSILGLAFYAQSQSVRMVLIEEATNASCGPCASQNPAFDILLNQNRDKLTAIKYHWYFPGYDPMHNHNVVENNARVSYYGISGVPTACIDGDIPSGPTFGYPGGPHGYTQELIDEYAADPSPFNIYLSHRISDDQDSIYIDMMIEATAAVSGNLVAHMVVVEKHINFATPPGSNGEKNFLDVMKKMVPDQSGTTLPTSFQPGEYLILQGSWQLQNIYDMDELGVVGFIQENVSKDVHQAGNSSTDPLVPLYDNEVNVAGISNISKTNCLGSIEPKITISNQGANPLTNIDIYYRVNDETTLTYPWTGNLGFLESEEIALPQIDFEILDENNFYSYTVNPNGVPDEYTGNDTLIQMFERAEVTPLTVKLMIKTDNNPGQTTWEILNSAGEVVHSGGPYSNPNTPYQENLLMDDMECYLFKIYDSGGDGLSIPGFYALYHGTNNYIITGTAFGSVDSAFFEVNTQVGVPEKEAETSIDIYPNPASTAFNLYFFLFDNEKVSIGVYDLTGRLVKSHDLGQTSAGPQEVRISAEDINPGLYLIQITTGGKTQTRKLNIVH
jgi:hypothetical protein